MEHRDVVVLLHDERSHVLQRSKKCLLWTDYSAFCVRYEDALIHFPRWQVPQVNVWVFLLNSQILSQMNCLVLLGNDI